MIPIPKSSVVEITILSIEGCGNAPPTISRIEEISRDIKIPVNIEKLLISTQEEANANKFMGSPTVKINGVDIDPEMRDKTAYGFM